MRLQDRKRSVRATLSNVRQFSLVLLLFPITLARNGLLNGATQLVYRCRPLINETLCLEGVSEVMRNRPDRAIVSSNKEKPVTIAVLEELAYLNWQGPNACF